MINEVKKYFIKYKYVEKNHNIVEDTCIVELAYTDLNMDAIRRKVVDTLDLDINPNRIEILLATLL